MTRLLIFAWTFTITVLAVAHVVSAAHRDPCSPAPAITTATPLGGSQAEIVYTGVCGATVKTKEKRANHSGECGQVAGCNAYYLDANDGDVTITSVYGPGVTTFRVCDVSGLTDVCSLPVAVTLT